MKRVFVFEYLSGGGLIAGDTDGRAAAELMPLGCLMRDALVADLSRLKDCSVTAATCVRAPRLDERAVPVRARDDESVFDFVSRQAAAADAAWVIAPETGGLLAHFQGRVGAARWLGCDQASIVLASSKQATLNTLAEAGVATPLDFEHSLETSRWVVKPDDGAGGVATQLHASREAALADAASRAEASRPTVEPWVDGEPLSISLLCTGGTAELLSVNRQRIEIGASGRLFFGGVEVNQLPVASERGVVLSALGRRVARAIPGLHGFVGIDLVWHADRGPVVIEVNPRVTCAFAGLSASLGRNLAGELLTSHLREQAHAVAEPAGHLVGWDIGGAHVKACLLVRGEVVDVAQWACPLWQGMDQLARVLQLAQARWPQLGSMQHAVTMTGEMVDLFAHREEGVQRIAAALAEVLPAPRFFAGDAGWCGAAEVHRHWASVASANWLATTQHAAWCLGEGVLLDIGSTTTDIIAFKGGRVLTSSRSDVQRLATGELVYQGVVRTPLCALAHRIPWRGTPLNVMNEYFATVADVYRLTGELNAEHDLYPPADNGAKDLPATRARLAHMIGLDARDAEADEWLVFAQAWRSAQVEELAGQLRRVLETHELGDRAVVVSAGCGDFLADDVVAAAVAGGARLSPGAVQSYGRQLARISPKAMGSADEVLAWAQVCAPCVAVATLLDREQR